MLAAAAMVMSLVTPAAAQTDSPARPTGLRLSAPSHELVRLTWRNPGDSSITGYKILRRLADYTTSFVAIETVTGSSVTSYEDVSVVAGTAYYYSIQASNAAGDSEQSNGMFDLYIRVPAEPTNDSPVVTGNTAVTYTENGTKTVARYRARDPDSNQFTWELAGTDANDFTITDGVLAFASPPDFENPTDRGAGREDNDYEVTVRALDPESASGELDVVVSVIGVNEPPTFTTGDIAVTYTEDRTGIVQTYVAMDPEGNEVSWSLSGTDRGDFTITGGELNFVAPPDFDAPTDSNRNNDYVVTVVASDGAKTSTRSVTVTVEDVDEPGTVTLSSPQPMVDIDLTATLSDPDGRLTNIEWQWEFQDGGTGPWADITGANSASFRPRASDVGDRLRVRVAYADDHRDGDESLMSDPTQAVESLRLNNLRPVFSSQSFTRAVAENISSDRSVGDPVDATDEAVSSLVYSLSGADAASFTIDSSSGQIRTSAPLDYETKRTYRVNVVATDSSRASQSVAVTIDVEDVEESLSAVTGDTAVDYAEDRTDAVATYTANDPDGTPVTWSLSGVDAGRFDISNRGVLSFAIRPDYDDRADQGENNTYDVTVEASSGSDESILHMMVTVTDIDEPLVLTGDGSVRFAENRSSSDTVHTYEADDPEVETVVWTLEGADRELFTITRGGELMVGASPDHENPTDRGRNGSYDVTVVASNKRHTAERDVTVTVTNVDEPATLTLSSQQPQAGTALTATLTDPDARIRISSWQWHKSPNGTDPWLDATGRGARSAQYTPGEGNAPPDGDEGLYLRVSVTYTDAFGSKALELITTRTVRAAPLTNSPPVFSSTDGRRSIPENTPSGRDIGAAFSATDTDSGDTRSYSLGGADADSFDIDASTGQLTTRAALDYEAKSSYEVTVRVTDPSNAFDDVPVTITVENVEEDGTVTLSGVPPEVGTRLTATLTDPDGDISDLTWQWQRSSTRDSGWTNIFAATSQTYTPTGAHTDYETDYYLRAVASYKDGSSPNTTDTADGTTLEIVERVQQQQRDTSTDDDDDRSTSSGSGTGATEEPDPEPEPADDRAFSDIDDVSSLHRALRTLSAEGVLDRTGCGRGRLCPEDHLLRWEMAVWLVRVVDDGVDPRSTGRSRFADVDEDAWWSPHVERLANLGITEGCKTEPLSYCPDQPVSRAQMASFLVRAFKLPRAGSAGFVDTAGSVHARNIDAIYAAEITIGCAAIPLMYCPGRYTTRAQMARFLIRGR